MVKQITQKIENKNMNKSYTVKQYIIKPQYLNIKPQCILSFPIKSIFYLHEDSEAI